MSEERPENTPMEEQGDKVVDPQGALASAGHFVGPKFGRMEG